MIHYKPLPTTLFSVRVPIIATYSDSEVDLYGLPMSVDNMGNRDEEAYKDFTTVMLPLTKLIDIYSRGYPIRLVDQNDINTIYKILEEYLQSTVDTFNNSPNKIIYEEERGDDIERFAAEIFGLNKPRIVQEAIKETSYNPFGLNLGLMNVRKPADTAPVGTRVAYPNEVKKTTTINNSKADIRYGGDSLVNVQFPKQVSYPNVNTERVLPKSSDSYAYMYDTLPDINIDDVERVSNYRKTYKT